MSESEGKKLGRALLGWALETGARAVSKGVESVLVDARDAVEGRRKRVEKWREKEIEGFEPDESGARKKAGT